MTPTRAVGVGEPGTLAGDQEITVQRQLEAARDRRSVDGPDQGLAQMRERSTNASRIDASVGARVSAKVGSGVTKLFQIQPCAKRWIRAGENDDVDVIALIGFSQQLFQAPQHLAAECISGLWSVEGDGGNPIEDFENDGVRRHALDRSRSHCSSTHLPTVLSARFVGRKEYQSDVAQLHQGCGNPCPEGAEMLVQQLACPIGKRLVLEFVDTLV